MIMLLNHCAHMKSKGLLKLTDYNYPIRFIYRYNQTAHLKSAEKTGKMAVEYAALLRVEFIPEGSKTGPTKDIYFKIFKKGSCGIMGGVIWWPSLDHPNRPGGEGMSWRNHVDGSEYATLGVTLPRMDEQR